MWPGKTEPCSVLFHRLYCDRLEGTGRSWLLFLLLPSTHHITLKYTCVVLVKLILCCQTLQGDLLCLLHFGHPWIDASCSQCNEFAVCSPGSVKQNSSVQVSHDLVSSWEDEVKDTNTWQLLVQWSWDQQHQSQTEFLKTGRSQV